MAIDFKTARPLEYYRQFIEKDVRPDGRELGKFRPTVLNIGGIATADGSALVKIGNCSVLCGIKAELFKPKTEEPNVGSIVPNVQLTPLCSSHFKSGPPGEQAQVLSQLMVELIENSKCIKKEDLCIVPGKLSWVLFCDMLCMDYDGNLMDVCSLSLVAALKNTSLPEVMIDEETEKIKTQPNIKKPIPIHSLPVTTTFAVFDEKILIVDPTLEEEDLATGTVTVTVTENAICGVHKPGGSPLKENQLQDCIERAFQRYKEAVELIEATIADIDR